ncbi:hypothetical protein H8356DRAFT_1332487, partial [Neocallimastix lanati (nom. inval.)]
IRTLFPGPWKRNSLYQYEKCKLEYWKTVESEPDLLDNIGICSINNDSGAFRQFLKTSIVKWKYRRLILSKQCKIKSILYKIKHLQNHQEQRYNSSLPSHSDQLNRFSEHYRELVFDVTHHSLDNE